MISDIHGCFDEFQRMLDKIGYSDSDRLILAGDHIDRGPKSLEMLRWLERRPPNVTALLGNHDVEFMESICRMRAFDAAERLETDAHSAADTAALYETILYMLRKREPETARAFDRYRTLERLIRSHAVTALELYAWAAMIWQMPYFVKLTVNGRPCVVVHAGYREGFTDTAEAAAFYLYAREDAYREGGIEHGMIIAGHTPTVIPGTFVFNDGRVFRHYDEAKDCIFYNIDCGCVLRQKYPNGRLACIRAEDARQYYV